jgi:uncharacterized membrane protein (DUF373 family)
MFKFLKDNYQILTSVVIFSIIIILHIPFYKAIILMLEFIVIIEVIKMISDFVEKKKIRLRFAIDVFIIFLIRDVIILTSKPIKDYFDIIFLIGVIFSFFIFRIMALKYSPTTIAKVERLKAKAHSL